MPPDLSAEIQAISEYTSKHSELLSAHHFLYDLRLNPADDGSLIVMGINPGESDHDWELERGPTQETSMYDFHEENGHKRESIKWHKKIDEYLSTDNIVLGELFFWSSKNMKQFKARYGSLKGNKHLDFCKEKNLVLFEKYQPKAIIFPGKSAISLAVDLYNLKPRSNSNDGLVVEYHDGVRPWIFTWHWTGAWIKKEQKAYIKERLAELIA